MKLLLKHSRGAVVLVLILVVLLTVIVTPARAAAIVTQHAAPQAATLEDLLAKLPALLGFSAIFTLLINLGKQYGIVKDGQAPNISAALNIALLAAMLLLDWLQLPVTIDQADQVAGTLAKVGELVLLLVAQIGTSRLTHEAVRGTAVIGKSYSLEATSRG